MAVTDITTRPGFNMGLFGAAFAALRDWNDARVTRKALSALSPRELDDIGLCAGDIEAIATRSSLR